MSRKKRQLTEEETALWHKVARSARPLEGRISLHREKLHSEVSRHQEKKVKPGQTRKHSSATDSHLPSEHGNGYGPDSKLGSAVGNIDRRASRLLGRGRVRIDARLDLHGMTQDAAHMALQGFLYRSRQNGIRYALVITGKSGVLNRMVPVWLGDPQFRVHVSGVTAAAARHGGHGALYIRLRRNR